MAKQQSQFVHYKHNTTGKMLCTVFTHEEVQNCKSNGLSNVCVSYKFRGGVPALSITLSCRTFHFLTHLPYPFARTLIPASAYLDNLPPTDLGISARTNWAVAEGSKG